MQGLNEVIASSEHVQTVQKIKLAGTANIVEKK